MMGSEMIASVHGTTESILFALASSNAPALHGFANKDAADGCVGLPGWREEAASPDFAVVRREGERYGEENDNRYRAMKKSSFAAQQTNRTVYIHISTQPGKTQ
jgi:hypothetical protein